MSLRCQGRRFLNLDLDGISVLTMNELTQLIPEELAPLGSLSKTKQFRVSSLMAGPAPPRRML